MTNEQPQTLTAPTCETERQHERPSDPKAWMNVSTFTVLELSEDEMEHIAGARASFLKITD
jgi:hypothetical protein